MAGGICSVVAPMDSLVDAIVRIRRQRRHPCRLEWKTIFDNKVLQLKFRAGNVWRQA
ncbi:MAG: hypothetical protein JWR14_4694 [Caballeronia sp.]|jgi:hypothetical protein|nr:hypothetical protein [Caballeronia sp.]